jgi:hypothetical protein
MHDNVIDRSKDITICELLDRVLNKGAILTGGIVISVADLYAVFLLDKERKDALIHVIEELQNQYPGLNFVLTGPWPPYNFVESTIK